MSRSQQQIAEMAWADEADLADELAEELEQANALNAELLAALQIAQGALAMMIDPNSITKTTLAVAFAQATEAEAKARAAIAKAVSP